MFFSIIPNTNTATFSWPVVLTCDDVLGVAREGAVPHPAPRGLPWVVALDAQLSHQGEVGRSPDLAGLVCWAGGQQAAETNIETGITPVSQRLLCKQKRSVACPCGILTRLFTSKLSNSTRSPLVWFEYAFKMYNVMACDFLNNISLFYLLFHS